MFLMAGVLGRRLRRYVVKFGINNEKKFILVKGRISVIRDA